MKEGPDAACPCPVLRFPMAWKMSVRMKRGRLLSFHSPFSGDLYSGPFVLLLVAIFRSRTVRPTGIRVLTIHLCTCPIFCHSLWVLRTSSCCSDSSGFHSLRSGSCTSGRGFAPASLGLRLMTDTLAISQRQALTSPRSGLSPIAQHPCRSHKN